MADTMTEYYTLSVQDIPAQQRPAEFDRLIAAMRLLGSRSIAVALFGVINEWIKTSPQVNLGELRSLEGPQQGTIIGYYDSRPHPWYVRVNNAPEIVIPYFGCELADGLLVSDEYCWTHTPGGWTCVECREQEARA